MFYTYDVHILRVDLSGCCTKLINFTYLQRIFILTKKGKT